MPPAEASVEGSPSLVLTPSQSSSSRRERIVTATYFLALAVMVFSFGMLLAVRPIMGRLDFWAHANVGRWICENGRPADRSMQLWTADEPWVYHSWLSQVVFYYLTQIGDWHESEYFPEIILGFTAVLSVAPFAVIWYVWFVRSGPTCLMALPFALAFSGIAEIRFEPRPELFTAIFLTLLLAYLSRGTTTTTHRWLKTVLILLGFTLWANFHGAVVFGILILFITAVCDFLQNRRDERWKHTALLAVLSPLAASITPYGLSYWSALRPIASQRFSLISEWLPIWHDLSWTETLALTVTILPALALIVWALNPNRRWAQLVWLILFATMFVTARRNIWPFVLVCLLVLATNAGPFTPTALWSRVAGWLNKRNAKSAPAIPSLLRWAFRVAVFIYLALSVCTVPMYWPPRQFFTPARLEAGIVRYVKENQLQGRVFNDYENSSYLQWQFRGQPALYIDGLNAYPDNLMTDYGEISIASERGLPLLDEQGIEIVILTTNRGESVTALRKLADHLDSKSEWARVYAWHDGAIWVRRVAKFEHLWRNPKGPYIKTPFRTLETYGRDWLITSAPPGEMDNNIVR